MHTVLKRATWARLLHGMNETSRHEAAHFKIPENRIRVLPAVVEAASGMFKAKSSDQRNDILNKRYKDLACATELQPKGPVSDISTKSPIGIAELVSAIFTARGMPHAIGGSIANGVWSEPRGTIGVDISLFVHGTHDAKPFISDFRDAGIVGPLIVPGKIIAFLAGETPLTLFTPLTDIQREAQHSIVQTCLRPGGPFVPVLSAESITSLKIAFFRSKDIVDVERMVQVNRELDHRRIRDTIVRQFSEADERTLFWDRLVKDIAAPK